MLEDIQERMASKRLTGDCDDPYYDCPIYDYVIPVVFHVVLDSGRDRDVTVSDYLINKLINNLNLVYGGTHPKQATIDPDFAPVFAGDTKIKFVRASVDPYGNPHSGIQRRSTTVDVFQKDRINSSDVLINPDKIVKFYANGGLDAWPCDKYLNIWICDLEEPLFGGLIQGYATFPHMDLVRPALSGVVLDAENVFYYPDAEMVAAHETGHWLSLIHTFQGGCVTGCAYTTGDMCEDTPTDSTGQPCESTRCGHKNMNENIMDYSDCTKMFTREQFKRMACAIFEDRNTFIKGRSCVGIISSVGFPPPSTTPVCFGTSRTITAVDHPAGVLYEWEVIAPPSSVAYFHPSQHIITIASINPAFSGEVTIRLRLTLVNPIGTVVPCGTSHWHEYKLWFGRAPTPVIESSAMSTVPNRWDLCTEQETDFTANIGYYPPELTPSLVYNWNVSGGYIGSGAGTSSIVFYWMGSYALGSTGTVKVTVTNECGSVVDIDTWKRICAAGGGGRMAALSPNPTSSGQVVVSVKEELVISPNGLQITVKDSEGSIKLSQTSSTRQTTLDISSLKHGLYVVTVQNGQESEHLRLVVE